MVDHPILSLLPPDLRALAAALGTAQLNPRNPSVDAQRIVNAAVASEVATELQDLAASGLTPSGIALHF